MRASWPYSIKLSILNLLLNPPSVFNFIKTFVKCSWVENVAHFFPPHKLHLDLTFLCEMIVLTVLPFEGLLKMAVYRLN